MSDTHQWCVLRAQDGQQCRTPISGVFYMHRTVSSVGHPSVICSTGTGRSAVSDTHQWCVLQAQDGQQCRTTVSGVFYGHRTVSSVGENYASKAVYVNIAILDKD